MIALMEAAPAFTRLDPDGRRRQILEAARRSFADHPYGSVSVEAVAREAGVTRGLIHHYFGTKRELFRELIRSLADVAPSLVRIDLELSVEQAFEANADAWLDFIAEHRELALTIGATAVYREDPQLQRIVDDAREEIVDRLLGERASSAPPPARFVTSAYPGLVDAAGREWLHYRRVSREQVRLLLVTTLLAMMRETLPTLLATQ